MTPLENRQFLLAIAGQCNLADKMFNIINELSDAEVAVLVIFTMCNASLSVCRSIYDKDKK